VNLDEFDEHDRWTGTCDRCGTSHGGWPPDTAGAASHCLAIQLRQFAHGLGRPLQWLYDRLARRLP
jgi:hypothetical protein